MARFLLGTIPVVGHVTPGVAIARTLVERGHEVCWYTGKAFQSTIEATGAQFIPITTGLDYSNPQNIPQEWADRRNALRGPAQLKFDLKHFFIDAAVGHVQDLTQVLKTFAADVLLTDAFFLAGAWLSEQGGPPWAEFGISALGFSSQDTAPFGLGLKPNASWFGRWRNRSLQWLSQQLLFQELTTYTNQLREPLGLPPSSQSFFDTLSPFLYMAATIPSFEYPRHDLPPQVHFIGPLRSPSSTAFTLPDWWHELEGNQPVIHVTQGTVATQPTDLIIPTLQALAGEDVLVVATTVGVELNSLLASPPANARIEPFIPHAQLLPHVDVMITNGGFNGVQMALAHGIPLIVAGQTEDKPEIGARVEWSGVGINLRTKSPRPAQIQRAVNTVLKGTSYKIKATALQAEINQYCSSELAATLLEQLASTKQPVLRT